MKRAQETLGYRVTIDLPAQTITGEDGLQFEFEIDPFRKHRLENGLDDIGMTLQHEAEITRFEQSRPSYKPSLAAG